MLFSAGRIQKTAPNRERFSICDELQVLLDCLGCLCGVIGDGHGDLHVVDLSELSAPCDESFAGGAVSAEYTKEAISTLFYNLPITGYASIGYDAIPKINDAVGGVDVECLEDLTYRKKGWTKGTQLHLE